MIETMQDFYNEWKAINELLITAVTDDETGEITHIYMEDELLYYCIVAPHGGNGYKYMLRVNPKKTFDRWINADIEEFYDLIEALNYDLRNNKWIYRTLLEIYIDKYMEEIEQD